MKKLLFILFVALLSSSFSPSTTKQTNQKSYKTKYVVVLVIDGPRYSETFGDSTCKYIPNMAKIMTKEGVLFTDFKNNGPTWTISGHAAITTGNYQNINNSGKQLPKNPSFFQYYLESDKTQKTDTWIISSKGKLEVLTNTTHKNWKNIFIPMSYCGPKGNSRDYGNDDTTMTNIQKVFNLHPPKLLLINLLDVDINGHEKNWEGYLNAIQSCDKKALQLWKMIQNNPEMKNQTTLFITNDHGRHLDGVKDGFISHGDGCAGCRHISLLAMGPDFKKDVRIDTPAEMIDISKTIAELLHFDMPSSKGRVLTELFE